MENTVKMNDTEKITKINRNYIYSSFGTNKYI